MSDDQDPAPAPAPRLEPRALNRYPKTYRLQTRWSDNDVYGHVNNAAYYLFFDTAVNRHLIETGALDIKASPAIGLVAETRCAYFRPLVYPEDVIVGLALLRLGRTSVSYDIAVFAADEACAARGTFTHVYVDRESRRPVPAPDAVVAAARAIEV